MLVQITINHSGSTALIADMIAKASGNDTVIRNPKVGIYEVGHFSLDNLIVERHRSFCDEIGLVYAYGVCDDYDQILELMPEIEKSDRKYAISITPVKKSSQSPEGGWRWHKWGPYIGKHEITTEYLYDEPIVEKVYCFQIFEIIE